MTIALDMPPDIETRVRQAAAQHGMTPETYILHLVEHAVSHPSDSEPEQPKSEAELLQQINLGIAPATWQRYHVLREKRHAQILTRDEQQELIAISDALEQANAQRMAALVALAHLRQTSLEALMDSLNLHTPVYE